MVLGDSMMMLAAGTIAAHGLPGIGLLALFLVSAAVAGVAVLAKPEDKCLPSEAARIIGCSTSYVRILTDTGQLPAERGAMGIRLLDRKAVEDFAKRRRRKLAAR